MAVEITQATYDQLSGLQQYAQNEANQSANVSNLEGINRDAAQARADALAAMLADATIVG